MRTPPAAVTSCICGDIGTTLMVAVDGGRAGMLNGVMSAYRVGSRYAIDESDIDRMCSISGRGLGLPG